MKIKICGLKYDQNIRYINRLQADFMGFIFYPKSKRFINISEVENSINDISPPTKKVAVFVNETAENITAQISSYQFDVVQLHGNEEPKTAERLKSIGYQVIKAFSIHSDFNFEITREYNGICDYFLFDTATSLYGGSGKKFDWQILSTYEENTPFFLSGGINSFDAKQILNFKHPQLFAVDVNSGFEVEPGLKDIDLLHKFIKAIKYEE